MARWLVTLIALGAFVVVTAKYGPDWADLLLGFVGFLIFLGSKEFAKATAGTIQWLRLRWPWLKELPSWLGVAIRRIVPAFSYVDFSLVLVSLHLLCAGLSESFITAVEDLVAKGFVSFNSELGGFVHMRLYILGYVFMPPFLLAGAGYGFYRGMRDGRISFAKLALAILCGLFAAILVLSLIHGGFTGFENYREVSPHVSPNSVPGGAQLTAPTTIASAAVAMWLAFTTFAWVFGILGYLFKRLQSRAASWQ